MKSLNQDFISAAEQVNIWVFLGSILIAVGCMFPEAIMEASDFNSWLALQANFAMVGLCVLWLTTQTMWAVVRKYVERRSNIVTA